MARQKQASERLCLWWGASFGGWLRLLARNRFAIGFSYWPRAALITAMALHNSALGLVERLLYGRRAARMEITAPLFIIGHWRSGTTLLHEYLTRDPRHGFPATYDCFCPCHFLLTAEQGRKVLGRMLPDERPMDSMQLSTELPQEDDFALALLGHPSLLAMLAFPNNLPGDGALFDLRALPRGRRLAWQKTLKRFLQRVMLRAPDKRLVLKSPIHTARIPAILEIFPDARFLYIHRDPFSVYPSTLRLVEALYPFLALQRPRHDELERLVVANGEKIFASYQRDSEAIPQGQLHELSYEDLVRDPVAQLQETYAALDLGDFEAVRDIFQQAAEEKSAYRPRDYDLPEAARAALISHWPEACRRYGHGA